MSDAYTQIVALMKYLNGSECARLLGRFEARAKDLIEQEEKQKRFNAVSTRCQNPNITMTHGGLWNERN